MGDPVANTQAMGQELKSAFPSAVLQIRKLLVTESPLANPLGLTVSTSKQAEAKPSKLASLNIEGKAKVRVKCRKENSRKRTEKEGHSSQKVKKKSKSNFRDVNVERSEGQKSTRGDLSPLEGEPPKKKPRNQRGNSGTLADDNPKKQPRENTNLVEDEYMVLVTELGVTER